MHNILHKLWEEFLKVLPPTIFFFVALHLIAVVRVLIAKGTGGLQPLTTASILISALVLGKVVLVADMLPWINMYPHKPLIYNVAWKTAIYLAVAFVVHYLERLYDFSREAGGIAAGNRMLLEQIVWPHFWAIQIILLVLILMYCTGRELIRVVGREKVVRMFFGPVPLPKF